MIYGNWTAWDWISCSLELIHAYIEQLNVKLIAFVPSSGDVLYIIVDGLFWVSVAIISAKNLTYGYNLLASRQHSDVCNDRVQ
jgi:hypothetical protein